MSLKTDSEQEKVSMYRKVVDWLKKRYSLDSDLDFWMVIVLFAITGSSSVRFGDPLLAYFGVIKENGPLLFWLIRLPVIFIFYQILFVCYGFLIGLIRKPVWNFAWFFAKKMLSRFGIKFKS